MLGAVAELRARPGRRLLAQRRRAQRRLPRERAEADHHARRPDELELALQPRRAALALLRQRLVRRRRAADRGGDPAVAQRQAVVAVLGGRLVGEAGAVQRGEQEVARAVAGEDAAGAVGAVRGRRQAEDQHARRRVAEAGDRAAPVVPVAERRALLARDELAPLDEPRAGAAGRDLGFERLERGAHTALARGGAAPTRPSTSRPITGSSSRMSAGSLVRSWREASSTIAPTIANASCGEASRSTTPGLGVGLVGLVDVVGDARQRGVAALRGARAGADDLDQQRLRLVGEGVDDLEERAHRGADAALRRLAAVVAGGARDALDHHVDGGVEQREDALLLVAEVLVERRLRHPRLARDRLRGGVGEAGAGEDGRGRGEQARALAILADLERRGVASARCCLLLAHLTRW